MSSSSMDASSSQCSFDVVFIGAGRNALSQGFTQRSMAAHRGGYATAVPGLYLIGAATWPGPGVTGAPGRAVARALLSPYRPR